MRFLQSVCAVVGLAALAGCGTLPADGPLNHDVQEHAKVEKQPIYALVDLNYPISQTIEGVPAPLSAGLGLAASDAPSDRIGQGDILAINVYEQSSSSLFGRSASAGLDSTDGRLGTAGSAQSSFPHILVDAEGRISLPFAGSLSVEGLTADEAAVRIRQALKGRAVDPQILVSVMSSAKNSVIILGEVRAPGRFQLSPNNDHILDVIADAGGVSRAPRDLELYVVRGDETVTLPFEAVMEDPHQNIRLAPHDQIRLLPHERKFSTFGALGRINEMPIVDDHMSLTSAISRVGGMDTNSADDAAVMVFRFERPAVTQALGLTTTAQAKGVPVIYRLNMHDPNSYFVADNFEVQPGDIVYVPRSSSTTLRKFLDLVNVLTEVTYTSAVTSSNLP